MITEKQIKKNKRKQNKNKIKNGTPVVMIYLCQTDRGHIGDYRCFFYNMRLKKIKKMTIHIV